MKKEYLISDFRLGLLDGFCECSVHPFSVPKIISTPERFERMMKDHIGFWGDTNTNNYHRVSEREVYERGYIVGSFISTVVSGFTYGLNNLAFRQSENLLNQRRLKRFVESR